MFDFAWSEIALIAAVALIAIGPKDMPAAIRGITDLIKKARRMAAEFQTHVDEMVRDANLDEMRSSINEIRNFDVRGEIERRVDPDGSLRDTFATNPLQPTAPAAVDEIAVGEPGATEFGPPPPPDFSAGAPAAPETPAPRAPAPRAPAPRAPAFVPPNMVPPPEACSAAKADAQKPVEPEPPAFIPPEIVLQRRSRPSA